MGSHVTRSAPSLQHAAFGSPLTPDELLAWFRRARARSRAMFQIAADEAYYDRPIALRNPIVFYEGHLPAFAVNTLVKLARGEEGVDTNFEVLFERGIDPDDESTVTGARQQWPAREVVQAYGHEADARVERAFLDLRDDPVQLEAAGAVIEHELMHQETFLYMLHNLAHARKKRVDGVFRELEAPPSASPDRRMVRVPAGVATVGNEPGWFGWDNEFPVQRVAVEAFDIDAFQVTNGEYLDYMDATGASAPHFWTREGGNWLWRGMFENLPLPLDAPVYVTHQEACAFARWRGARLPTEGEYHRAAFGAPDGGERPYPWGEEAPDQTRGWFDFASADPAPVGAHPRGASAWGVHDLAGNGWEWTSTTFSGFAGFQPMPVYRAYSADFFDGQHFVLKGGSPVTARELLRRSFRNWFRPNYPYVYATFRCVR